MMSAPPAAAKPGDMEGSIALYERALACNARHADALYNLGVACGEAGRRSQRAVFYYELAMPLQPGLRRGLE